MSPTGQILTVTGLTKNFGKVQAVRELTFTVQPGRVTGFLGPNGSGKTTTLRCLLGLVRPTQGSARVGEVDYRDLPHPATVVGAALEASGFHPGRTARGHLQVMADAARIPAARVNHVLTTVRLVDAANRKVGGYSLGMRQRLALAGALLGDPGVLILDEPANGLDPEGIAWLRNFLRAQAQEGRTVLVSSHVLSEVQQTVDDVVIISHGHLVSSGSLADLTNSGVSRVRVRAPEVERLKQLIEGASVSPASTRPPSTCEITDAGTMLVTGMTATEVGRLSFNSRVELHELNPLATDLEAMFLELTSSNPGGA